MHNTRDNLIVTFACNKLINKEGFFSTSDPFIQASRYIETQFAIYNFYIFFIYNGVICLGKNLFSSRKIFFILFLSCLKPYTHRMNEDGTWTVVWQNEHVNNSLNPRWAQTVRFIYYFSFFFLLSKTILLQFLCSCLCAVLWNLAFFVLTSIYYNFTHLHIISFFFLCRKFLWHRCEMVISTDLWSLIS